jgi:hypothetical protein
LIGTYNGSKNLLTILTLLAAYEAKISIDLIFAFS